MALAELKRLERVENDACKAKRLRTVIFAMEGSTAPGAVMAGGLSRRVCQQRVH